MCISQDEGKKTRSDDEFFLLYFSAMDPLNCNIRLRKSTVVLSVSVIYSPELQEGHFDF